MNGTNYEVPHCGAFSTPHFHPSWAQIFASGIPITDNNLKLKLIQGITAELQRMRKEQVNYNNKQTNRPVNFEIHDKVRHKVPHRHCEKARVIKNLKVYQDL